MVLASSKGLNFYTFDGYLKKTRGLFSGYKMIETCSVCFFEDG